MSALRELAGTPLPETSDVSPKDLALYERMKMHAYQALQTCQPPTWSQYFGMDWMERGAIHEAQKRIRGEERQIAGFASQSPLHAALAGADADDFAAAEMVMQQQTLARALAEEVNGQK